jgi:hypothetical protein
VRRFCVFTDSQSSIRFLAGRFRQLDLCNALSLEIGLKLYAAQQSGVEVMVCWVPGHVGIFGNEEADRLARDAKPGMAEILFQVGVGDLSGALRSFVLSQWEDQWFGEEKGRSLFSLHPSVSRPRELDFLAREDAVLLSRLRTGHVLLNSHSFDLGMVHSAMCSCGRAREDVEHFLVACSRYAVHRAQLKRVVGHTVDLCSLLGVWPHAGIFNLKVLRAVAQFCRKAGRFV